MPFHSSILEEKVHWRVRKLQKRILKICQKQTKKTAHRTLIQESFFYTYEINFVSAETLNTMLFF